VKTRLKFENVNLLKIKHKYQKPQKVKKAGFFDLIKKPSKNPQKTQKPQIPKSSTPNPEIYLKISDIFIFIIYMQYVS